MMHLSLNKILTSLLLIIISSCGSKSDQVNENFKKRYGLQVESMNARRTKEKEAAQKLAEEQSKNRMNISTQIKEDFLPSSDALRRLSSLPDDMFMIRYYSYNFPDSYGRPRLSFDDIQIPTQDAFGVATDLGEKNYQLVDGQTLQRDVDFVRSKKEEYDDEISLKLIREEKERKRREYLNKQAKEKAEEKDGEIESGEIENDKIEKEEETNDENQKENTNPIAQ